MRVKKKKNIPLEKIQYALDHPGIMVVVDTIYGDITCWRKGLWIQSTHTIKYIAYSNKKITESSQIIKEAPDNVSWIGVIVLVLTMLGLFYWTYSLETWIFGSSSLTTFILFFTIIFGSYISFLCVKLFLAKYNYLFLLPILLMGLAVYVGDYFGKKREKRLKAEQKIKSQNVKTSKL